MIVLPFGIPAALTAPSCQKEATEIHL